jgi:hypothetical protein
VTERKFNDRRAAGSARTSWPVLRVSRTILGCSVVLSLTTGCGARTGLLTDGANGPGAPTKTDDGGATASGPPCGSFTNAQSCAEAGCALCTQQDMDGAFVDLICHEYGAVAIIDGGACDFR